MPPPAAWCTAKGTDSRPWYSTATTVLVGQLLSAGLETQRARSSRRWEAAAPAGVLLRHDVPVRRREGCADAVELVAVDVPREIEVREGGSATWRRPGMGRRRAPSGSASPRLLAGALTLPGAGLSTASPTTAPSPCTSPAGLGSAGAGRERRRSPGPSQRGPQRHRHHRVARGRTSSSAARPRRGAERFDTIVLDPPAFAKSRASVPAALRATRDQPPGDALPRSWRRPPHRELLLSTSAAGVSGHAGPRRPATAAAASACDGIWARARTIPRCSPSPKPATSRVRSSRRSNRISVPVLTLGARYMNLHHHLIRQRLASLLTATLRQRAVNLVTGRIVDGLLPRNIAC
jgi:hypothetical protein